MSERIMDSFSDAYFDTGSISLYYRQLGSGKPLILLHGWLQTGTFWSPYLDHLTRSHTVYAIDLRGHGKTSVLSENFSIQLAADDIVSFIRGLGLDDVRAVGLSYGGLVLLEIMAGNPDLIESAVLIGSTASYDGKKVMDPDKTFRFEDLEESFRENLLEEHAYGENQVKALFSPETNYKIELAESQLRNIQTRMLILNGDSDEMAGIDGAINIFRTVPGASLWILPGTGHLAMEGTSVEDFCGKVLNFLEGF